LTDCFQTDTDSISSPYRPLVQGLITKPQVLGVSLAGLLGCCAVLFAFNPFTLFLGLLSVFGLATYTYFKRRWWAGPFYNAWIVALIPVIAVLATGTFQFEAMLHPPFRLVLFSVFFGYANFVLMGYFKDLSADRATGYKTLPVVFGWQVAAAVSDLFGLLTIFFSGWLLYENRVVSLPPWQSLLFWIPGTALILASQWTIHRIRVEASTPGPIANIVRGYILIHLGLSCAFIAALLPWGVLFYGLFEWTLQSRPEPKQI
jgi:4-hydroxybenzoate polyprenyltransferase